MNGTERVKLSKVIEKMQLKNLTPDIDTSGIWLHMPEVNRPALQLTGFYDQFDNDRIQIIGNVEYSYSDTPGSVLFKNLSSRCMSQPDESYLTIIELMPMSLQCPAKLFIMEEPIPESLITGVTDMKDMERTDSFTTEPDINPTGSSPENAPNKKEPLCSPLRLKELQTYSLMSSGTILYLMFGFIIRE